MEEQLRQLRREVKPMEYMSSDDSLKPYDEWFYSRLNARLKSISEYDDISKYDINYEYNIERNMEITYLSTLIKVYMQEVLLVTNFDSDVIGTVFTLKRTMYDYIVTLFGLDPCIGEGKRNDPILDELKTVVDSCYAHLCFIIDRYEL
jgi:hypothetical protein